MISKQDLAWHRAQAKRITQNNTALSMFWWEVGHKINEDYGYLDPDAGHTNAHAPERMPGADSDMLAKIYQVTKQHLQLARRFSGNPKARTRAEAEAIAAKYGTWSDVVRFFIRKQTVEEDRAKRDNVNSRRLTRNKTRRAIAEHVATHAIVTVPDDIRDELQLSGYDASELIRDMLEALGAKNLIDVCEQLDVIKRPRRPRVRVAS
jgi:hypothetical protein